MFPRRPCWWSAGCPTSVHRGRCTLTYAWSCPSVSNRSKRGSALAGTGLLAASVAYLDLMVFEHTTSAAIALPFLIVSLILCLELLVIGARIDCTFDNWEGLLAYSIFGVLNMALYAGIGLLTYYSKEPPSSSSPGCERLIPGNDWG